MRRPLVSVVIPAYHQAEFVGEAIRSVLAQTYPNFEIIVVDDASLDHTAEVVSQFKDRRVKLIVHPENRRLSAARNTGIEASAGEIIALLDADDFFHPHKLKAHVDFLLNHEEVGVTYNARFELNHSSRTVREIWRPPLAVNLVDLLLGFPFAPSDMVMRRDWALQVGLFDPAMGSAEDTDFPCRLALAGCKFASVDQVLNYRRYHSGRGRKNLAQRLRDVARAQEAIFADPRCPAEAIAIQDTAIKHHLMVIVSLALLQEETEVAQASICNLARIDFSTLEGNPCELMGFLMMESVADENLDHEILLRRMLSQFPLEMTWLAAQYDWAVARGYLWRGARAVIWDRPDVGQRHLMRAAELHAEIDELFIQFLTHHLINYEVAFGADAAYSRMNALAVQLATVGGRVAAQRLRSSYSVNRAFQKYQAGEHRQVPKIVLQSLANHPAYLTNRGVLSILLRSIACTVRQSFERHSVV